MKSRLFSVFLVLVMLVVIPGMSGFAAQEQITVYGCQMWWDQYDGEIAGAFEKETGIKVNYVMLPNSDADYNQKANIAIAGNTEIDVITVHNPILMGGYVDRGAAVALDKLAKSDRFDLKPYGKTIDSLRTLAKDKKLYGMPTSTSFWMLYYNKDLFDAAGVPYPTDNWTWDDFRAAAKKLTKGEGQDKIWGSYFHPWPMYWYGPALQKGIKWYSGGKANLAGNKDLIKGLEMMRDMAMVDKSIPLQADNLASKRHYRATFDTGKYAMIFVGEWAISFFREDQAKGLLNFKWDVAAIPVPKGVKPGTTWGNPIMLMIPKTSKNQAAAWKYIKFFSSEPGQKIVAKYRLPILKGYSDIFLKENPGMAPPPSRGKEVLNNPNANVMFEKVVGGPKCADYDRIITEEGGLVLVGSKSPKDALITAEKRINDILAQP